ncbi:DUF3667 domain-containing protein [Sandaracinomonas limnophila]|uniref:DUF3667 domain-containing protein n=1 Tax=Sandaracinomonas limnophila TaxID=1862386 RepID=A0A437PW56_9BACT|nr:DUF3667 domain-containing protein [Sandaracinomonas limnophila]RVU26487.1 DUF3667 domain-containing protein [Sandaracinomonas limnophila]
MQHEQNQTCKNCQAILESKFCSNCGQNANTHRITFHDIWHDIQHGLMHFDNGVFFTIKHLLLSPGKSIKEFLEGKRVNHFKPLSFVLILATIYAFIGKHLIIDSFQLASKNQIILTYLETIEFTLEHLTYAIIILIITTSISSFLIFKKQGFNFAEHLVINSYYRGLFLLFLILVIPFTYFSKTIGINTILLNTALLQMFDFSIMLWSYFRLFDKYPVWKYLLLTVVSYVLMSMFNIMIFNLSFFVFKNL